MKKKTGYFFLKFFIRATIGMALIFIINKYVLPADSSSGGTTTEPATGGDSAGTTGTTTGDTSGSTTGSGTGSGSTAGSTAQ